MGNTLGTTLGNVDAPLPCLQTLGKESVKVVSNADQKKISRISYEAAHERVMLKLKAAALRRQIIDNFRDHIEQAEQETREARDKLEEVEAILQGRVPMIVFLPEGATVS